MKNAIVIGATGGIGSGLVKILKDNNYNVISIARSTDISCDLTDYKQISNAIKEIKKELSKIDLLVNAAGVATYKNLTDVSNKEIQEVFMINLS